MHGLPPPDFLDEIRRWCLIAKENIPELGGGVSSDQLLEMSRLIDRLDRAAERLRERVASEEARPRLKAER